MTLYTCKTSPVKLSLPRSNRSAKSPSASIPRFHHVRIHALSVKQWTHPHTGADPEPPWCASRCLRGRLPSCGAGCGNRNAVPPSARPPAEIASRTQVFLRKDTARSRLPSVELERRKDPVIRLTRGLLMPMLKKLCQHRTRRSRCF